MKKKLVFALLVVLFVAGLELFLRIFFGFCDAVLIQEDPHLEYIAQPDQKRFRFRNHIQYNSKSMRSEEIDPKAIKILGFGDSVLNGGVQTDQDSLATTLLSEHLSKKHGQKVQFLNISMGSWGPDNCYAYLKKYGDFGTKGIYLFVSSHDAYDTMNFEEVVDVHKSFPSKQYSLAVYELLDRYLLPRIKSAWNKKTLNPEALGINKKKEHSHFNAGFESFLTYSKAKNIPLTIYLHANLEELKSGFYNVQGKEIIEFAQQHNIDIILDLENGLNPSYFRDNIHINAKGQRKLAMTVLNYWKNNHEIE